MAVPASWLLAYSYNVHGVFEAVIDARGICPHCRISTNVHGPCNAERRRDRLFEYLVSNSSLQSCALSEDRVR